jgi:hypothetical protein
MNYTVLADTDDADLSEYPLNDNCYEVAEFSLVLLVAEIEAQQLIDMKAQDITVEHDPGSNASPETDASEEE